MDSMRDDVRRELRYALRQVCWAHDRSEQSIVRDALTRAEQALDDVLDMLSGPGLDTDEGSIHTPDAPSLESDE